MVKKNVRIGGEEEEYYGEGENIIVPIFYMVNKRGKTIVDEDSIREEFERQFIEKRKSMEKRKLKKVSY